MTDLIVQLSSGAVELSTPGTDLLEAALGPIRSTAAFPTPNFHADIVHLLSYGQSLSVGTDSNPAVSTAQRFDNLTFDGGVRAAKDGGGTADRLALVPLVESNAASVSGGPAGETPLTGATDAIKELVLAENGVAYTAQSFQLLGSSAGFPALDIATLAYGGTPYTNFLIADVNAGKTLAAAAGKTFKCLGFIWMQGESDTGNTSYHTELVTLRGHVDTDVKAITGQSEDVYCFAYGGQEMDIVLQQNAAAVTDPKIIIVAPMYPIPHYVDGIHLTALGEKTFGAYAGRAFKRTVIDGTPWVPLRPKSTFRQGKLAEVRFDVPHGPLVFDTTAYGPQTNMGFRLFAADGTTPITISSVAITQPDTVRIATASAIPANAVLRYGLDDPTAHTAVFGGNLRDSDPTVFGGGGLNLVLRNWCVCFEQVIT